MPNFGTITGGFSGGTSSQIFTFRCDWKINSQNVGALTSSVTFKYIVTKTNASWQTYKQGAYCTEQQNGFSEDWYQDFNIASYGANEDYLLWTTTRTIQHQNDGTANIYVAGSIDLSGTSAGQGSLGNYISLTRIPTSPPTVSDITATDSASPNVGAWVATKSIPRLSVTASAVSPASSVTYQWYRNDVAISGATSATYTASGAEQASGNVTFKVIVTDNFGITTTKSTTINFLAYSLPTITTNTFRCNSGGTATDTGSYVSATATFTVANVGSNAGTCTVTVNGHTATLTSGTPTIINAGLSDSHTYNADYTVTDSFGSAANKIDILLTAFVDFSLHPNGGVAFGGVAEQGKFKTAYPITIGSTQITEAQLQALLALI